MVWMLHLRPLAPGAVVEVRLCSAVKCYSPKCLSMFAAAVVHSLVQVTRCNLLTRYLAGI